MKLARIALGYAAIVAIFVLLTLPPFWLATPMERVRSGMSLAVLLTATWAIVSLTRRRPAGVWLTVGLGAYAALAFLTHSALLRHAAAEPARHISDLFVATHWIALVLAAAAVLVARYRRIGETDSVVGSPRTTA